MKTIWKHTLFLKNVVTLLFRGVKIKPAKVLVCFQCLLIVVITFLCIESKTYAVGATTPFASVEGEGGTLGGGATIIALASPPSNSSSSPQLEASGHAFVQLNATDQSVTWTNNTGQNISALNVRFCIPDASSGGGATATLDLYVNGIFRQVFTLNSTQSWEYSGDVQNPSAGNPFNFWDEAHFFINSPEVPAGGTITFQKDSGDTAAFYYIDVVDMENPPGPLSQPVNSLSITSYGAVANNPDVDNTTAIQNCINAAQSQGKIVWIPSGTFYLTNSSASLSATGITIQGAGMWYSIIYANPPLPDNPQNILYPTSCTVQDVAFDANARSRAGGDGNGGGLNVKGNNWVVNRVWIQHLGAGIWAEGSNGIVENCRSGSTWADGININNGSGAPGNDAGVDLVVSNCFIRGSGDDGLAINSSTNGPGGSQMTNATIVNCTSVAPWGANNLGIYGGVNDVVSNNLCMDSVSEFGISVGEFGNIGPLQSGVVVNNTLLRCGSYNNPVALQVGQTHPIANVTVNGNIINDSLYVGLGILYCGANVTVQDNTISAPGTTGMLIPSDSSGAALIAYNTVQNLNSGQSAFLNDATGTFTANLIGNSWQGGGSGVIFYSDTQYDGTASEPLGTGSYTLSQLAALGCANDAASSVMIPSGWTVTLYADDNFSGTSWTLTGNTPDFTQLSPSANDQMSSCIISTAPQSGHYYHLICASSGMALDNSGSTALGTDVTQWTDETGNDNQLWELVDVGGGDYNLICQTSGMALDNGGSTTVGTAVTQWSVGSGNVNQYWQFVVAGGGYYNLVCEKSGMLLDNGGSTTAGTDVKQWTTAGNPNQLWWLEFVR